MLKVLNFQLSLVRENPHCRIMDAPTENQPVHTVVYYPDRCCPSPLDAGNSKHASPLLSRSTLLTQPHVCSHRHLSDIGDRTASTWDLVTTSHVSFSCMQSFGLANGCLRFSFGRKETFTPSRVRICLASSETACTWGSDSRVS